MNREKGTIKLSGNLEPQISAPLDARTRVDLFSDLISPETWTAKDGEIYSPNGIPITVYNDTRLNNGIYYLPKTKDFTVASNWLRATLLGWASNSIFELYNDKVIKKLIGYTGGTGDEPTENIGLYYGPTGFTDDKDLATDFRGFQGFSSFEIWHSQEGNEDKTYEDYIAYIREPLAIPIAQVEALNDTITATELVRNNDESTRILAESERAAAEVLREQTIDQANYLLDNINAIVDGKEDKSSTVYLLENEYQVLIDNDLVLPDVQYNIFE